ncbi:MAG: imidazolonepropionase [Bacteriovoracia bacterium]
MRVYRQLSQVATLSGAHSKGGRHLEPSDLGILDNAAIVFDDNQIHWVGNDPDLPEKYSLLPSISLAHHVLTPAIVDSHTHLLFGGNRSSEYAARLNGEDYQAIARAGGGILFTMRETLKLSQDELVTIGRERLERLLSYGVRTVEMKSGYALTTDGELRLLRAAKVLKTEFSGRVNVFSTYLGAHAVPKDYASSTQFLHDIVIPTLTQAHAEQLVDAVDIFAEDGYFSPSDVRTLFEHATRLGLPVKIHADEFNDNGGARLAAEFQALSADHLLKTSADGIHALAISDTVATILPGTAFFLGKPLAPARQLLDAGCRVAIASDFNPGSSHVDNLLLVASLAAPSLKINLAELWCGITMNAAAALGMKDRGCLVAGMKPEFALFAVNKVSDITYGWGRNYSVTCP